MSTPPLPPPQHKDNPSVPERKAKEKSRWQVWGESVANKGVAINDWAAGYANSASKRLGAERFWPSSNDFPEEVEKCVRILRTFTEEGIAVRQDKKSSPIVKKKIPPQVIRDAKGICIYTSMKSALAPFGGMNGTGLLLGRLPDGSWSPPSCICPNYYSAGFVIGLDIVDIILIINTEEMLNSFRTHKFAITAETVVSSGPLGTPLNSSLDIKTKISPIYSYVNSRGFYAGIEVTGQAFLDRFDENERVYYWPGIKAGDILDGKVKIPEAAEPLYRALREAEYGVAQAGELEKIEYLRSMPTGPNNNEAWEETLGTLKEGEHIHLPPTPEQMEAMERAGIKDEFDEALERKEKEEIRRLPPPPSHPSVSRQRQASGTRSLPPVDVEVKAVTTAEKTPLSSETDNADAAKIVTETETTI